jgi:hypothetical protein
VGILVVSEVASGNRGGQIYVAHLNQSPVINIVYLLYAVLPVTDWAVDMRNLVKSC